MLYTFLNAATPTSSEEWGILMRDSFVKGIIQAIIAFWPYLTALFGIALLYRLGLLLLKKRKLKTSYDFYQIVSQFGIDHTRDELIVYSKDPERAEQKMTVIKHNHGMDIKLYDKAESVLLEKSEVSVNDVALIFQKMWQPPPVKPKKSPKDEKPKKKEPLVFK